MSDDLQQYSKTFLEKKEGKIGSVIGLLMLGGAGWLVLSNIVWIIGLLTNVITAMALGGVVVLLLYLISDKRVRAAIWYLYQAGITKAIEAMWRTDPISVAWTYVLDLEKYREKMSDQISNLKGQINSLLQMIAGNKAKIEKNAASARKAQSMGAEGAEIYAFKSRSAGRLANSNVRLEDALKSLEKLYKVLLKMYDVSGVIIEDTKEQIFEQTNLYKAMRSAASAFSSAKAIIRGDKEKKFIFDGAMEFMQQDIANKAGEIQSFMDMSKKFLAGVDIDNAIFEENGMKLFDEWAQKNSMLLGDSKRELVELPVLKKGSKKSTYDDLI